MKNSKDYSKNVQSLYRSLKKKHPQVEKLTYDEPADALVYAMISEHIDDKDAHAAMKRFGDYFVDLNDLRVSRPAEIVDMIEQDTPVTREVALTVTKVLRAVFDGHHRVSLESLKKMGKRPAKNALEKMEGVSRFVVDYCMLTAFGGHAIPLTVKMLEYLRKSELVHPQADEQEIEGFLAKQIAAKDGYEFYWLLRRESEVRLGTASAARAGKAMKVPLGTASAAETTHKKGTKAKTKDKK
jgi:endonuclease III